jgi:predicted adenylyl cyclase CyaB
VKNIEIKYRVKSLDKIQEVLRQNNRVKFVWTRQQEDRYYKVKRGRLKLRLQEGSPAELIFYRRADSDRPRKSHYEIYYTPSPESLQSILTLALDSDTTIQKTRALFVYHNVRIHLDRVKFLGEFLELESVVNYSTSQQQALHHLEEIQQYLQSFLLKPVAAGYADLMRNRQAES